MQGFTIARNTTNGATSRYMHSPRSLSTGYAGRRVLGSLANEPRWKRDVQRQHFQSCSHSHAMANPKVFFDVSIGLKPGTDVCSSNVHMARERKVAAAVTHDNETIVLTVSLHCVIQLSLSINQYTWYIHHLLYDSLFSAGRLVFELFADVTPKVLRSCTADNLNIHHRTTFVCRPPRTSALSGVIYTVDVHQSDRAARGRRASGWPRSRCTSRAQTSTASSLGLWRR